jgi:cell division protein FtsI/penicillin-binding protein 2
MDPRVRVRIRVVSLAIVAVALVLLGRLYMLQIVQHDDYYARAERQYVRTTAGLYDRGSIFFTTKDGDYLSAAAVKSGFVLVVNPTLVPPGAPVCEQLVEYVSLDVARCQERIGVPNRVYVELASQLDESLVAEITAQKLPGVQFYPQRWRDYPGGPMAARTIGFVGFSDATGDALHGRYGLERHYDSVLYTETNEVSVNFFAELFGDVAPVAASSSESETGDIVTTLEPAVSRMLDAVLERTNTQYSSRLTGAVIMNPKTGAIYAMNAVPSFDLNHRSGATIEQFQNPLVENVYEFGSTIKALTIAAGLDAGAIAPYSTYYDAGEITLNGFTIRNFDGRARGTVDMQAVLNQSLNTGVSHIVQQMGRDRFREYFLNFKLGSETGIDLPNEVHGLVSNLQSPRDVEYATASFGQGIAMTPIAATRALAALGNGGRLVTPHLVSRILYDDGTERPILYPEGTPVLTPETSEEISRMLVHVVDNALRGGTVALSNHTIGAKTGTAQIPDPVNGGYYDDKYLHSFFGYFPAFDPQFIVFMYTVEPQGVQYASETLTEPFMDIARFLINYYSIPPDR